jgi:hypothetical protein
MTSKEDGFARARAAGCARLRRRVMVDAAVPK